MGVALVGQMEMVLGGMMFSARSGLAFSLFLGALFPAVAFSSGSECSDLLQVAKASTAQTSAPKSRQIAAENLLAAQWRGSGLTRRSLERSGIFSEANCAGDKMADCLAFLQALALTGKPALMLLPKSAKELFPKQIGKVRRSWGDLQLVEFDKDAHVPDLSKGTMRLVREATQKEQALKQAFVATVRKQAIPFDEIWRVIADQVIESSREGAQLAMAFNYYLLSEDSHAYIQSAKEIAHIYAKAGTEDFAGIGMHINSEASGLRVTKLLPEGSAAKYGLHVDDLIVSVNHQSITPQNRVDLLASIEGPVGSIVEFQVKRGDELISLAIPRTRIQAENVVLRVVDSHAGAVGYIQLRSFANMKSCQKIEAGIRSFRDAGVKSLVLDLRGNSGGYSIQAQCIAGLFLGKVLVARQMNLDDRTVEDIVATKAKITNLPLVVLIDSKSASASELLAGALRDYERAWLLGETSYGKGSVQKPMVAEVLDKKGRIYLYRTMARFEQPSGSSNQLVGIEPHFLVPNHPSGSWDDLPREIDLAPKTPEPSAKAYKPRNLRIRNSLAKCMEKTGLADTQFYDESHNPVLGDYRLLKALDLLACLAEATGK